MDTDSIMLLVVLGVLVLLSAFFSSAETAVLSVNKVRMMDIAEEGNKKAKLVLALLDQQNKLISTLLVGNNIVNIGASSLATKLAMDTWGDAGGRSSRPAGWSTPPARKTTRRDSWSRR